MKQLFIILLSLFSFFSAISQDTLQVEQEKLVYVFEIKEMIGPAIWRQTQKALSEADSINADIVIIDMNTYGGILDAADSIRTRILNYPKPVWVFINNNAASAGALISIACDRIYMRPGGNIGAATVVNQSGEQMPDKYQSFMRSMMRATAEFHGKDTIINNGDTTYKWKRDPLIAEAMVDTRTVVGDLIDSTRVLSFTTNEAIEHNFCEGKAENIQDIMELAGIKSFTIKKYHLTPLEKTIGFLVNPYLSGILIMVIVGGIYFELQSPGIGFPLAAAILAAVFYFAPLYLEGLAENWEIIIFVVGIILIALEVFVIPGFGIAGVAGIILTMIGLTLSMIDNIVFDFEYTNSYDYVFKALMIVISSFILSFFFIIYLSKKLLTSNSFLKTLVLNATQNTNEGFIGVENTEISLVGETGIAVTILRPVGKIEIKGEIYDAKSEIGYINKTEKVKVVRHEAAQLYVIKEE